MKMLLLVALVCCIPGCGSSVSPDAAPIACCPRETPTCDCFQVGGPPRADGTCVAICDLHPGNTELVEDEATGCEMWREVNNGYSCFPAIDAGVDAGVLDAAPAEGR